MTYPAVTAAAVRGGDVVIVGGGLMGLATAAALAARGAEVTVIADHHAGEASRAAAGMLAPGVEHASGPAHTFALAARDLYPSYVEALAEFTGTLVPLNREGIIELVPAADADARRAAIAGAEQWIDRAALRTLEPAVGSAGGAVLYPADGAVDNVALMRVLRQLVEANTAIQIITDRVARLELDREPFLARLASRRAVAAATIVVAAGAWSAELEGLPRPIPVEPVRGQMIALEGLPLRHVTYGAGGYLVPRGGHTVIGATMERVGFEVATTPEARASLTAAAADIAPSLARARLLDWWSGLRPMTPDQQPIIGPDPDVPRLLYACGHSRNGILLGPLTGECVAALAVGETPGFDLAPFSVTRFDRR